MRSSSGWKHISHTWSISGSSAADAAADAAAGAAAGAAVDVVVVDVVMVLKFVGLFTRLNTVRKHAGKAGSGTGGSVKVLIKHEELTMELGRCLLADVFDSFQSINDVHRRLQWEHTSTLIGWGEDVGDS